jgi:hypothetical protein
VDSTANEQPTSSNRAAGYRSIDRFREHLTFIAGNTPLCPHPAFASGSGSHLPSLGQDRGVGGEGWAVNLRTKVGCSPDSCDWIGSTTPHPDIQPIIDRLGSDPHYIVGIFRTIECEDWFGFHYLQPPKQYGFLLCASPEIF